MEDDVNQACVQQKGFRIPCGGASQNSVNPEKPSSMRPWQLDAFESLKDATHMILNAPMGSGKSTLMCFLAAFKMRQDPTLRCIIAVPQTIIASGFGEDRLKIPDGEEIEWKSEHNLCESGPRVKTGDYILRWLTQPHGNFSERILVCTHAGLLAAYKKLQKLGQLSLFTNCLLWLDEAHHIMNTSAPDIEDLILNNGIGGLVAYLLSCKNRNIQIGLTTASFFRGDRLSLLTVSV